MPLVISDLGEVALLNKMLHAALSSDENFILKLFQNNVTPDSTFIPASFVECNFTNYAAKTLTRANWNNAISVAGVATASYGSTPQQWTCSTTGNTIYGYWIEGANTPGVVMWAEKFGTARIIANGDVLNLTPVFTFDSAN